ncbi:MAG: UDP-N-acetylmuramoyl-tripeptide--D-alanyl-D-alanine ligase [Lachnospiraceae bacterium]|nr:UDP-N-acetylmuramoyl-tripeptide--D-alanyl-D-alanine ligase [Lachnospiraceae bacterium]
MKNMTLENIARACGGIYYGPEEKRKEEVEGISIDSRKIEKKWLFVATKGQRVDGHSFIPDVLKKGALCVVSEQKPEADNVACIFVEDSFKALKDIAEFYRNQMKLPIIGITGSVGKTSTKEMIAAVVSEKYNTLKTEGNFNNEVGVPLTIFRIREEHQAAVVEMGISDFGEMHRLSRIVKPDLCVITNIGQCHLENLGDRDGVLRAKTEIFDYMKEDAPAILNGDDDKLSEWKEKREGLTYFSIRQEENRQAKIFATHIGGHGIFGTDCTIHTPAGCIKVHIPIPGEHMVNNALAATAVGLKLSLSLEEIKRGIEKVEALEGRSHLIITEQYTILDDCYNANPVSMKAALNLLGNTRGRRCAIIGSMFELGEKEKELHKEIGSYGVEKQLDVIVAIGELGRYIYEGALERKKEGSFPTELFYFETVEAFLNACQDILKRKDALLIKASHGMNFQVIVEKLRCCAS